jgi:hypothetical protein
MHAGVDVTLQGVILDGLRAFINGERSVSLLSAQEIVSIVTECKQKEGAFSRSKKSTEASSRSTAIPVQANLRDVFEVTSPMIDWRSPHTTAAQTNLITPDGSGTVRLPLAWNASSHAYSEQNSSLVWRSARVTTGYGSTSVRPSGRGLNVIARYLEVEYDPSRDANWISQIINTGGEMILRAVRD